MKATEIEKIAQELEARLLYRSESGAFTDCLEHQNTIVQKIEEARDLSDKEDFNKARSRLLEASLLLVEVNRGKSLIWRSVHIWGALPFLYFLILTIVAMVLLFKYRTDVESLGILDIPLPVLAYAFLGGLLRGLWWLIQKVQMKHFRPQFTMPYIAGPWVAILLGIVVYQIITSGIIADMNPNAVNSLVFIGGFSWEWVMQLMDRVKKEKK